MTCGALYCDPLRPEDGVGDCVPFLRFVLASLHNSFSDIEVAAFYDTVGLGVVSGDAYVVDFVFVREVFKCCEEGSAVVRDDLHECAPTTEEFLINEVSDRLSSLVHEHAPLGPGGKGATSLNNVPICTLRHVHGVEMRFVEERSGSCDGRRDAELSKLSELAFVAGSDVPLNVLVESRPPEALEKLRSDGVDAFVSEGIVGLAYQVESRGRVYDLLMDAALLSSPRLTVSEEEGGGVLDESAELVVGDGFRSVRVLEEASDLGDALISDDG